MNQVNSQKMIWDSEYQNVQSVTLSQMAWLCQGTGFQTYLCAQYFFLVSSRKPAAQSSFVMTTFYWSVDDRQ